MEDNETLKREKKFQFQMYVWVVALLPQKTKINISWNVFSLREKNVDFSPWQCIVQPKWTFLNFLCNALFASKAKITVFWNFFERSGPKGASRVKKIFQKTLILVFEVIVQPPKTHFLTFLKVQEKTHYGEKKVRPKSWKAASTGSSIAPINFF